MTIISEDLFLKGDIKTPYGFKTEIQGKFNVTEKLLINGKHPTDYKPLEENPASITDDNHIVVLSSTNETLPSPTLNKTLTVKFENPDTTLDSENYYFSGSVSLVGNGSEWITLESHNHLERIVPVKINAGSNQTLGDLVVGYTLNGYTLQSGDRILLDAQTDKKENGIYTIPLTRTQTEFYPEEVFSTENKKEFRILNSGTVDVDDMEIERINQYTRVDKTQASQTDGVEFTTGDIGVITTASLSLSSGSTIQINTNIGDAWVSSYEGNGIPYVVKNNDGIAIKNLGSSSLDDVVKIGYTRIGDEIYVAPVTRYTWGNEASISPVGVAGSDEFGFSVSVSGDKMAVGARGDDDFGSNSGAVYTFQWNGSAWIEDPVVLRPSGLGSLDNFSHNLSMSGDKLAVGARLDDDSGSNAGAVYTFQWNGSAWIEDPVVLRPSGIAAGDFFGESLSMNGDKLAVGVRFDDVPTSNSGACYTFQWNGSAWIEDPVVLRPSQLLSSDQFGQAVSISGNKMAVGAYGDDGTTSNTGAVYTFQWNGSAWIQDPIILAPTSQDANDYYGGTISMSGDKMAVGTWYDDDEGANAGAVYTYQWNGSAWIETNKIAPIPLVGGEEFSFAISMDNNHMAVGGFALDRVYTFYWNGSIWEEDSSTLSPSGITSSDKYGFAVSMSGDKLAVGSYLDNGEGVLYTYTGT